MIDSLPLVDTSNAVNWDHPLNQGRAAWWLTLPNAYGGNSWYDLVGNYQAALTNSPLWNYPTGGLSNPGGVNSLRFNGTAGQKAACNILAGQTFANLSISGWVWRGSTGSMVMFGWGDYAGAGNFHRFNIIWYTDSKVYFQIENGTGASYYVSNSAYSITGWHHFALTFAAGTGFGYMDGNSIAITKGGTANIPPTYPISGNFDIGAEPGDSRVATGKFNDISVWTRTVSPNEISSLYNLSQQGYPEVLNRRTPQIFLSVPSSNQNGQATLSGVGSLHAIPTGDGKASLAGVGTLTAKGSGVEKAVLAGVGSLTAKGSGVEKAVLAGVGNLSASGGGTLDGVAHLSGVGNLHAVGSRVGKAVLAGVGTLSASGKLLYLGAASLAGVGNLSATGKLALSGKASLAGVGNLVARSVNANPFHGFTKVQNVIVGKSEGLPVLTPL